MSGLWDFAYEEGGVMANVGGWGDGGDPNPPAAVQYYDDGDPFAGGGAETSDGYGVGSYEAGGPDGGYGTPNGAPSIHYVDNRSDNRGGAGRPQPQARAVQPNNGGYGYDNRQPVGGNAYHNGGGGNAYHDGGGGNAYHEGNAGNFIVPSGMCGLRL